MKKIIFVLLCLILGNYALAGDGPANSNVLSAGPEDTIPLRQGSKVGFKYVVSTRHVGFLSVSWVDEVRINWRGTVKNVFENSNKTNVCFEENCSVYTSDLLYVRDENTSVTISDGRTFKISEQVLDNDSNRIGKILAFAMNPSRKKRNDTKNFDRFAFIQFEDSSVQGVYLSSVAKAN